ncbi:MAG: hypothetical protein ABJB22_03690 [Verrucomicrobiota bacterium]
MSFSRDVALRYLRRAHEQNRLAHAYLISGVPGSGKRMLAAELASLANGTRVEDVFTTKASEIFVAEPESKSRRIVIGQIRDLEHSLQMRATPGRRKVAIVSDADRLQAQAANAFLKTLEEPPRDSLLLLLSALPEVLPDTILSRCIGIPLAINGAVGITEEETELVELLRETAGVKDSVVQPAYRLAQGFHRLLGKIREKISAENAAALKQDEARYRNTTDGAWLEDREDYYKALSESRYLQKRARLIETLYLFWSDILRANSGVAKKELPAVQAETNALASRLNTAEILRRLRQIEELRDHLGRNIQEALALEVALLRILAL